MKTETLILIGLGILIYFNSRGFPTVQNQSTITWNPLQNQSTITWNPLLNENVYTINGCPVDPSVICN
jgi:hypothetical protein